MTTSEWRPYSDSDDIQVGSRFHHEAWGDPSNPNNIITQVTMIEGDYFWWKLIQPEGNSKPYKVGQFGVLATEGSGWFVIKPFEELAYDPTQMGDKDDDI